MDFNLLKYKMDLGEELNTLLTPDSWNNVSGGLDKVSASALGFAWGIGQSKLWTCQLPCSGDWKDIQIPGIPVDLTTDDTQVYVLFQTADPKLKLGIKPASNTADWISVDVPTGITKIVSTSSYVWGQSGSQKYKLPKPGTTGNWLPVVDSLNIKITSASSKSLYGVDATGVAMKTDESLQSGWAGIPEFVGAKFASIIGDADQTAVYGLDTTNQLKRCASGKCSLVGTQGYTPQNITVEPIKKQLWMTSETPGESGNIFMKSEADYGSIMQIIQPLEKQRDDIVIQSEKDYQQSTLAEVLNRNLKTIKDFLERTFRISPEGQAQNDKNSSNMQSGLNDILAQIQQLENANPIIQHILWILGLSICIYLFGSLLGWLTHIIAFVVLVGGIIYYVQHK